MDSIGIYLFTAILAGVIVGVATRMSHSLLASTVEGVSGIILILILSTPLFNLLLSSGLPEITLPDMPDSDSPEYVEVATEAMEEGIARELAESFSLSGEEVRVVCRELDLTEMRCGYILVELSCGPGDADFPRIRRHVVESYVTDDGGECDVRWIYG